MPTYYDAYGNPINAPDTPATNTLTSDFLSRLPMYSQGANLPQAVTMADVNRRMSSNGRSAGGYVDLSTPSQTSSAQGIADMINSAVAIAGQGGYNVPTPPAGMSAEDYQTFLSSLSNLRNQMNVDKRGGQALGAIQSEYSQLKADPTIGQAQSLANQTGVDWDLYNTMRQSLDAQYNRNAAGQNVASRGLAGSSAGQLAGNQSRMQYAGQVAGLYPTAAKDTQALRSQSVQTMLQPFYAKSAVTKDYLDQYNSALRAMFGQPEFVLNS